jgi:hypothetical protein
MCGTIESRFMRSNDQRLFDQKAVDVAEECRVAPRVHPPSADIRSDRTEGEQQRREETLEEAGRTATTVVGVSHSSFESRTHG